MNRKGFVGLIWYEAIALGVILGGIVALPFATPGFRENKAKEYCEAEGHSAISCELLVESMSKEEVLDYIKDKPSRPRP